MLHKIAEILLILQPVIFVYFIVLNGFYTLFTVISLRDIRNYLTTVTSQSIDNTLNGMFYRPLSILVPAFNEEKTIVASIKSLLALRYPEYEVIVINDGSTDGTLERLIDEFRLVRIDRPISLIVPHEPLIAKYVSVDHPHLFVLDKENGGKADALNAGINASQFPLFCSIDADSVLENDALIRATRLFVEDREVIATGGIVRVLNGCEVEDGIVKKVKAPRGLLACFQSVEYTKGFLSGRTSWNYFQSLLIISGAFGIFRKDIVMAVRGYRKSVGEDMDLVVRLHRHCRENKIRYKVVFVPDPVCWTQVPSDLVSLLKQRNRWHRGLIDSLWHSKRMFLNPRFGMVGLFGFPYFFFVETFGPAVEFLGYVGFLILFLLGHVSREFAILFFLLAVLWGTWINLGSILLDNLIYKRYSRLGDIMKLCFFGLLEFFGYRQIIVVERLIATFFFWKKGWGKPKRREIHGESSGSAA
ncbi:glycosyltransferase family 2 protein [Geobacter pickeringii]|uniref:Glycosyl transferase n=1 Tax=Geobacter pickeringii TaxID=345632 RepID=A0A0B5B9Q9_9BACT|nr:glycosyltransferase [Geobacter pickeringii]AJE03448.1 glycosyl transferase [Geobacter pickeringii]